MKRKSFFITALSAALATACIAKAQPVPATPPSDSVTVSRQEFEQLKREHDEMKQQLQQLVKDQKQAAADADDAQTETDNRLKVLKDAVDFDKPGKESFTVVGDASVGFTTQRKNASSFSAGVSPLMLWQIDDHMLIETAFDINIGTAPDGTTPNSFGNPSSSTSFDLTIGDLSYIINDNLTVGGGLFVVPFDAYHNHFDPPWITKLPDDPLPFADNPIVPDSEVGIFARGAFELSPTSKVTYDTYVTNGPNLVVNDNGAGNPSYVGTLNYDDFTDQNNNKAVGGRVAYLPAPNIEMGYSVLEATVNPRDFQSVFALLNGVDLNIRQEVAPLQGVLDFQTEWVWQDVRKATYPVTGGPLRFSNFSEGGYVQLSYRPTHLMAPLKDLEFIGRFDTLNTPLANGTGNHEKRYTFGVDYWIRPNVVLKAAYEIDDKMIGASENAFLIQCGIGL
jgi:hypothetical protein